MHSASDENRHASSGSGHENMSEPRTVVERQRGCSDDQVGASVDGTRLVLRTNRIDKEQVREMLHATSAVRDDPGDFGRAPGLACVRDGFCVPGG